ncbi:MAG TPA: hypothetical protein VFU86_22955 [Terriglobales bacterium]|nr:hypothetical protein [Terriglobales bacterium]
MEHWFIEPVWQNYSSMYREAVTSGEAKTAMEVAHHRMATLYFGISAVETFLNLKMRDHLIRTGVDHDESHKKLRNGVFADKVKKWPFLITGQQLALRNDSIERLLSINTLRGNLTHQKNFWPETYEELSQTDPMGVVDLIAEFIVEFHHARNKLAPYWIWGWNYLNPQRQGHDIILLNEGQMVRSLRHLGYKFPAGIAGSFEDCQKQILTGYEGYVEVAAFLRDCDRCEPKFDAFPHQPKLCRRWWDPLHQNTCGSVSDEAIRRALELDELRARCMKAATPDTPKPVSSNTVIRVISQFFGRGRQ